MVDMSRYNKLRINPDRYNYDLATNLPLRRTFWRIADKTVLFDNKTYCILAIDIENFHLINKWYGRETGDELLIEIGEALKSIDAGYGTISGYMGGDNFCVIFEENDDVINLIRKRISGIVNGYRGHDITRAYYGAYKTADKDITTGEMCDYAYGALEIAKQRPDKDIFWYDESMAREQEAEAKLMPEICSAMDNGEFTFYLQPKCILQTGKIIGSEALVRWISPEKGFISPGQFIPLLEKNGFINKLDVYIWDKVCQTIRRWLDEGRTALPISINVSRADIYSMDVVRILKGMIEKYNISTEYIEIEITESAYVENGSVIKDTEKAFKNAGFKILIDDFGSGYSSLNMLKDIDADVLKLDMKFLDLNPENNDKGVSIITAVLDMARQLDIPAIAEGIETDYVMTPRPKTIAEYADRYIKYGVIHPDDVSLYKEAINLGRIKKQLDEGKERGTYQIRYNMDGTYKWYVFEVTKPTNYSEDNRRVLFTWKEADYQAGAREDAMDIIYNTFIKILRADFLHDRYEPIKSTQEDIIRDAGLSGSIKEYIDKYIDMGVVHPEDAGTYRDFANPDRVLEHFRNNKKSLRLIFRRLLDGEYKWMELVVSKSKDYSDEIPVFIYYLREVRYIYEDTMVSEIEKKKQMIYSQGK